MSKKSKSRTPSGQDYSRTMFFDIETIPDWERIEEIDGPDVLSFREKMDIPVPEGLAERHLSGTADAAKNYISENHLRFPAYFFDTLAANESDRDKPRKGVLDHINSHRIKAVEHEDKIRKKYSTSPEHLRIVAIGLAMGSEKIKTMIADDDAAEIAILMEFWSWAERASSIVGFNHLGFDLPAIFFRSSLLGVRPTRRIDLNPYGKDCVDLMKVRFGNRYDMGLKDLAACHGIEIPAGDCDGSQVEELLANDKPMLHEYVESDIKITRELFLNFSGYWLP